MIAGLIRLAAALLLLSHTALQAKEFDGVRAETILPDNDFFRMATCGAVPGGECASPTVRWATGNHGVALVPGPSASEAAAADRIAPALDLAIDRINQVGSGLTLYRTTGSRADIVIHTTDLPEGAEVQDVPGYSSPGIMGVGYVTLWWSDAAEITRASILFSTTLSDADLQSVVLEELFQALGARFDIEGPAYEGVSILSQTSNATTTIMGQDAALLRWLYPPKDSP